MPKSPNIFLIDILDSITDITSYLEGFTKDKFLKDKKTQDAVIRRIQIIGEAVKSIPRSIKNDHPYQWREVAGLRDVLVHQYAGVSLNIIWDIVTNELTTLKVIIEGIVESQKED